jgi:hypothetical protein
LNHWQIEDLKIIYWEGKNHKKFNILQEFYKKDLNDKIQDVKIIFWEGKNHKTFNILQEFYKKDLNDKIKDVKIIFWDEKSLPFSKFTKIFNNFKIF